LDLLPSLFLFVSYSSKLTIFLLDSQQTENFGALPNINALYNTTDTDPLEDILAP